jgi:hypothetical protein
MITEIHLKSKNTFVNIGAAPKVISRELKEPVFLGFQEKSCSINEVKWHSK